MLIKLQDIVKKYNLKIQGVIHIGAHYGQEYQDYVKLGIKNMLFFEPAALAFAELTKTLADDETAIAFKLALGNRVGTIEMYTETANKGMSSSILEPKDHLIYSPAIMFNTKETVMMERLDNIKFDRSVFNMINIDVQGYELEVFKGAVETLKGIDIIYTEINFRELYKDCVQVGELDAFLKKHSFYRILTQMADPSWGDALYLKYE
jgi:FkbM family methyltransferase